MMSQADKVAIAAARRITELDPGIAASAHPRGGGACEVRARAWRPLRQLSKIVSDDEAGHARFDLAEFLARRMVDELKGGAR